MKAPGASPQAHHALAAIPLLAALLLAAMPTFYALHLISDAGCACAACQCGHGCGCAHQHCYADRCATKPADAPHDPHTCPFCKAFYSLQKNQLFQPAAQPSTATAATAATLPTPAKTLRRVCPETCRSRAPPAC